MLHYNFIFRPPSALALPQDGILPKLSKTVRNRAMECLRCVSRVSDAKIRMNFRMAYIYIYIAGRTRAVDWIKMMGRLICVTQLTMLIALFQASAGCLMSTSISRKSRTLRPLSLQLSPGLSLSLSFTFCSNVLTSVVRPQTSPLRERGSLVVVVLYGASAVLWVNTG